MTLLEQTWLSVYIYYSGSFYATLRSTLWEIFLLLKDENKHKEFFYVRYFDNRPHVRLRIRVYSQREKLSLKMKLARLMVKKVIKGATVSVNYAANRPKLIFLPYHNHLKYVAYNPEIRRYGGINRIHISECFFCSSSSLILEQICNSKNWNYDIALGTSIQLIHLLVKEFFPKNEGAIELLKDYTHKWINHANRVVPNTYVAQKNREAMSSFEISFCTQKLIVENLIARLNLEEKKLSCKSGSIKQWYSVVNSLKMAHENLVMDIEGSADSTTTKIDWNSNFSLVSSYMHMTFNRLGIFNQDEAFVTYICARMIGATPALLSDET